MTAQVPRVEAEAEAETRTRTGTEAAEPAASGCGSGRGAAAPREFSLVVPAGWFCVPLLDDDERRRSVDALTEECFRGIDDQPLLKRQTRQTVADLAERASSAGGVQLYFALNTVAGVPLAASLLVSLSARARAGAASALSTVTAEQLAGGMRRAGTDLAVVELPAGRAVRRRAHRRQSPFDLMTESRDRPGEPPPVLGVTLLDYALPVPGTSGALLLSFSSPLEVLADSLVELFDAVAGTLRWKP